MRLKGLEPSTPRLGTLCSIQTELQALKHSFLKSAFILKLMIVKLLGAIDLIVGFMFIIISFGVDINNTWIIVGAVLIGVKGLFILTKNLVSLIDLIAAGILLLSMVVDIPRAILLIIGFFTLQKGFLSFL